MKTNQTANAIQIKKFIEHIEHAGNEVSDRILDGKEYDNKFNFVISCNGKQIEIDLNADFQESLMHILMEEAGYLEGLKNKNK